MIVVYKNTGIKITNDIWREFHCVVCESKILESQIALQRELTDMAGGTVYICITCVENGNAKKEIEKHTKKY